jgi:UDP-2,3-diacylglucosamine pyrophosphatase LpxH
MHKAKKRKLDLVVISDVHLGTYGCHAKELLLYLKSIQPKKIILNGDIIDIWQFSKNYFPESHLRVLSYLIKLLSKKTEIFYITGNHDEFLRKFAGYRLGNLHLINKLILNLEGQKAWFFHGDVFDITMKNSRWLAKLGGQGYDLLILLNTLVNYVLEKFGIGKYSFSKRIKNQVKSAVKFISNFEETVAEIAIKNKFDYVVCGHIHQPIIKTISCEKVNENVIYLNSGDWIENMTALEYNKGEWSLYEFDNELKNKLDSEINEDSKILMNKKMMFEELMKEFHLVYNI